MSRLQSVRPRGMRNGWGGEPVRTALVVCERFQNEVHERSFATVGHGRRVGAPACGVGAGMTAPCAATCFGIHCIRSGGEACPTAMIPTPDPRRTHASRRESHRSARNAHPAAHIRPQASAPSAGGDAGMSEQRNGRRLFADDRVDDAGDDGHDERAEHRPPEPVDDDAHVEQGEGQP